MEVNDVRALVIGALDEPALRKLSTELQDCGWTPDRCEEAVHSAAAARSLRPLLRIVEEARSFGIDPESGLIERFCLLRSVSGSLDRIATTPLTTSISSLLLRE